MEVQMLTIPPRTELYAVMIAALGSVLVFEKLLVALVIVSEWPGYMICPP